MTHVAKNISGKIYAAFLKYEYISTAAGTVQALWLPLVEKHPLLYLMRSVIFFCAVGLDYMADHQGHNFDHSHQPDTGTTRHITVDYGHHPLVLGVGGGNRDYGRWIAGVVVTIDGVEIDYFTCHRRVVVVVFIRCQTKNGKVSAVKSVVPHGIFIAQ